MELLNSSSLIWELPVPAASWCAGGVVVGRLGAVVQSSALSE